MSISELCQIPSIPTCTPSILDLIPTLLSHIPIFIGSVSTLTDQCRG